MQELINDYIAMNQEGLVLALCEKYYDDNVLMLNNGNVFAKSMRESYEKQKGFVASVKEFDVKLISQIVDGNAAELTFDYKMVGESSKVTRFVGKHIQTWKNGKIIKEEYVSIS